MKRGNCGNIHANETLNKQKHRFEAIPVCKNRFLGPEGSISDHKGLATPRYFTRQRVNLALNPTDVDPGGGHVRARRPPAPINPGAVASRPLMARVNDIHF